jgi:hypothetical protein
MGALSVLMLTAFAACRSVDAFQGIPRPHSIALKSLPRYWLDSVRTRSSALSPLCDLAMADKDESNKGDKKIQLKQGYMFSKYALMELIPAFLFLTGLGSIGDKLATVSGYCIAAGLSHILAGAAENERLGSDTYKRLNLALNVFHLISLAAFNGMLCLFPKRRIGIVFAVITIFIHGFGGLATYRGWNCSLGEDRNRWEELGSGVVSTCRTMWTSKGRGSAYRNALMLVVLQILGILNSARNDLINGATRLIVSINALQMAGAVLIFAMVYSLKDAGERGRLTGTTFIQMHFLVSIWSLLGMSSILPSSFALINNCVVLTLLVPTVGIAQLTASVRTAPVFVVLGLLFFAAGYFDRQEKNARLNGSAISASFVK